MAVRLKDRIEANIRQSDKVNSSLSINGKSYNGSSAITVGTLGAEYGGTGETSLVNASNALLNALTTGSSVPQDADYYISQYAGGGTTTTTFHRRPMSALLTYVKNKTTVSNTITGGTTAGPTVSTTVNGITGTAVTIPSASTTASGIVTTDNQRFRGKKTLEYPNISSNATRYQGFYYVNGAGTRVGDHWLDTGHATNITTARYYWRQYSPNSTADTTTTAYHETYSLPAVAAGLTENKSYEIFTSKSYSTLDGRYLKLSGGTVTGTVVFSNSTDAAPTTDNGPALIIGGTRTTAHIEIDNNEIIAKTNGTTETTLYLGGGGGGVSVASPLTCSKTVSITGTTTFQSTLYSRRAPNTSCTFYFRRAPNPSTTTWTSSDGVYTYTIDKANGETDIAYLSYSPSWAGKRVTVADGTTNNSYVSNGYLNFRNYSISSSTGAKLSYYYQFRLYPPTPADLTASKTFYFAVHTNSSISSSTSKRYVVGISGAEGGLNYNESVYTSGSVLYGACWNDYAEYRAQNEPLIAGHITYCDDDGKLKYTTERLQKFEGVISDTFGFSIGETDECKTPLAVSGRALVYCDPEDHFHSGDCVCAGPDGKAYRMTREEVTMYPDRIVGVVSEIPTYERWGTGNVEVNGRIWIKVK